MKKIGMRMLGIGMLAAIAVSMPVGVVHAADEAKLSASADLSGLSAYVWRGQVVSDEAVLQPSVTVTKGGFSINTWCNYNMTDRATGSDSEFSETDLTVSYSSGVGPVAMTVGLIDYQFPNQTSGEEALAETKEIYVTVGASDFFLTPTLSLYYDIDEIEGAYGVFAVSYVKTISDSISGGVGASVGVGSKDYNAWYFGVSETAVNDVNLNASLTFTAGGSISITPAFQYTFLPDSEIKDAASVLYRDDSQAIVSLKVSYGF